MLKELNADQARFIAILARTARMQRDALLGNVAEGDLGGIVTARGDHNPTADLGLDPLATDAPQTKALREAIASLSEMARRELYTLMRVGQGHLAAKKWHHGLVEAETLGAEPTIASLIEDPDLHHHLTKGLYEADLAS